MITLEEAIKIAEKKKHEKVTSVDEYTDAWLMNTTEEETDGNGPVVIMKEDGAVWGVTNYVMNSNPKKYINLKKDCIRRIEVN